MRIPFPRSFRPLPALVAAAALSLACADEQPLAPEPAVQPTMEAASLPAAAGMNQVLATLRRVTARYHDLDAALADGFVFLHPCEDRPGEGPVGIVYIHPGRMLDGAIDPSLPDALLYEPTSNGKPTLTGVEMVVPHALWPSQDPPTFLGATFQTEEEFGVYGLHVWIWRHNPEGMFAQSNPRVSCAAD